MGTSGDRIVVSDGGAEHIMTDVHGIDKTSGAVAITVGATEPVTVIADVRARQNTAQLSAQLTALDISEGGAIIPSPAVRRLAIAFAQVSPTYDPRRALPAPEHPPWRADGTGAAHFAG